MKKVYYSLMTILALASCAKETDTPSELPMTVVTIQADLNDNAPSDTKTTEDAATFFWEAEESISVATGNNEFVQFDLVDAYNGYFTHTFVGDVPSLLGAVSPFGNASSFDQSDGSFVMTLPESYNYVAGKTNAVIVAGAPSIQNDTYRFEFRHATALMKITYENVPVGTTNFVFSISDSDIAAGKHITGDVMLYTNAFEIKNDDDNLDGQTITINIPEVSIPNQTYVFYVPLPTGTYSAGINFYLKSGSTKNTDSEITTVKSLTLARGNVFKAKTITLNPVEIVKGAEWTYTFNEKKFSANGTQALTDTELVSMNWTLDGSYTSDGYWAYDSGKGQQFGSGAKPYSSLTLSANYGVNGIEDVVINTSGASSIDATVSVSVGATAFVIKGSDPAKTSASLTATATDYTFTSPDGELYVGDIVISYVNSSSKAIYLKTISLNPDTRIDPEFAYATTAYSVVASSDFEIPVLSAVEGFDGTVTYAIGGDDDPDVASVNAETGAVTIGAKAGSVTVTATFAGNANYKPDSASYTITVGAAALSVTEPAAAECSANSTTTFTVTSNVEWSATTVDGEIITNIDPSTAQSPSADPVTVTVTLAANIGAQRTATVKVRPTNQIAYSTLNQDVTVTQKVYTADVIYEKYSGVLTEGDYLFTNGTNALKAAVAGSTRLGSTTVSEYESGKIKNPNADLVWHISSSGDYWTLYNASSGKYVASSGSASAAELSETVDDYSMFSVSSGTATQTYNFINKYNNDHNVNAYFRWGGTYFACYAAGNPTTLYKKADSREEAGMSWSATEATATYSTGNQLSFTAPTLTLGHATDITYESTDETIATIDEYGAITIAAPSDNTVNEGSTTIKAIFDGDENYKPQTVSYTLNVTDNREAVATPTFAPEAGEVDADTVVYFECKTNDVTFYHTTNGSNPTTSSTPGTSVTISSACTVKVIATKTGYKNSDVATADYTISGDAPKPTLQYTLDGTITATGNAYATATELTQNSIIWDVVANTEMSPWRIGGKSITNQDRAIYSKTAITANISQINVSSGATASSLTVNSLTISVHNSANDAQSGSNAIATKTVTSGIASSTVTFDKADNTSWAGKYYRIVYNVTRTGSSGNGYITFNNATFYGTN